MNKKAFTYIETVISISIAAIIISMFILAYAHFTNFSEREEIKNVVQIVKKARVSAIMQSINVDLSIKDDMITVSNYDGAKIVYKLKHLKFKDTETYSFTSEGGTMSKSGRFNFYLKSDKSKKEYNVIIAAVGGQVRYEEV